LRAILHLIDSRHGPLEADFECFSVLKTLPDNVKYIVVLTKFDKLAAADVRKTDGIVKKIRSEVLARSNTSGLDKPAVSIVFTSAETRRGGCACWSAILDALSLEAPFDFSTLDPVQEV
jgi:GTP-binding protein EngB required for normal cell division